MFQSYEAKTNPTGFYFHFFFFLWKNLNLAPCGVNKCIIAFISSGRVAHAAAGIGLIPLRAPSPAVAV